VESSQFYRQRPHEPAEEDLHTRSTCCLDQSFHRGSMFQGSMKRFQKYLNKTLNPCIECRQKSQGSPRTRLQPGPCIRSGRALEIV